MSNDKCRSSSIISRLFHLRRSEYNDVVYNLLLFLLVGFIYSTSRVVSDSLFFSRFGANYLPIIYILMGLLIVPVVYWYKQNLIKYYPEHLFIRFTALMAAVSILLWFSVVTKKTDYVYPFFYLFNEIISSILLIHSFHYIKYYLDESQYQRLLPIVMIGLPFGGIIGGVLIMLFASKLGIEQFILVAGWGASVLSLLVWRYHLNKHVMQQDLVVDQASLLEDTFLNLQKGIIYFTQSCLFKILVLGVISAIAATYILNYQLAHYYIEKIDNEEALVLFLAWLIAVTSSIIFFIQIFSSSQIFTPIGLRVINLIPAFTLIIIYLSLLVSFTFLSAITASIIKDLSNIVVRTPTNHPFFQAIPKSMQPRCQLVMRILVIPFSLVLTGVLLLATQIDMFYGLLLGLVGALFYLWANIRSNHAFYEMLFNRAKSLQFVSYSMLRKVVYGEEKILGSLLKGMSSDIHFVVMENAKRMLFWFPKLAQKYIIEHIDKYPVMTQIELLELLSKELEGTNHSRPIFSQINKVLWALYDNNRDAYTKCRLLYLLNKNQDSRLNSLANNWHKEGIPCQHGLRLQQLANQYFNDSLDKTKDVSKTYAYMVSHLSEMLNSNKTVMLSEGLLILTMTPKLNLPIESLLPVLRAKKEQHRYLALRLLAKRKDLTNAHINAFYVLINDSSHRIQLKMIDIISQISGVSSCNFLFYALIQSKRSEVREKALTCWLKKGGECSILYNYIMHNKGYYFVNDTIMRYGRSLFSHHELLALIDNRVYLALELLSIIYLKLTHVVGAEEPTSSIAGINNKNSQLRGLYLHYAHQKLFYSEFNHLPIFEQFTIIVLKERLRQLLIQILYGLCHIDDKVVIHNVLAMIRAPKFQNFKQLSETLSLIRNQQYYKPLLKLMYAVTEQYKLHSISHYKPERESKLLLQKWCLYAADPWIKRFLCCPFVEPAMIDLVDRILLLKKMDIFNEVYTEDLKLIAEALEEDYLMSGDFVFKKGDASDSCYLISEGKVGMSVDFEVNNLSPLVTLKAGGYFGEMGVLDGHPRDASAYVIEDVRLLCISRQRFLSIIQHHPEIAISILSRMNSIIREQNQLIYK